MVGQQFASAHTDDQKRDILARVAARAVDAESQRNAIHAVAVEEHLSPRTIQRWSVALGYPLPVPVRPGRPGVANAARLSLTVTIQHKREMAQDLLRVGLVLTAALTEQARKGADAVDGVMWGRAVQHLKTLDELDNGLMLRIGRFDASLSADEAREHARRAVEGEIDEYAQQFERDSERFGVERWDGGGEGAGGAGGGE